MAIGTFARLTLAGALITALAAGAPAASAHPDSGHRSATQMAGAGAAPAGCAQRRHAGLHPVRCFLAVQPADAATVRAAATADTGTCAVNEAAGYTPCNIQSAYLLTTLSASRAGRTVAVVDPLDDPNAESDLGVYRTTYGLPSCTTANRCFRKVNQRGVHGQYPTPDAGSAQEISLDIDMVSALCPNCHILLVEADSYGLSDLLASVQEAVQLHAKIVSNSWGTGEFDGETSLDASLDAPGVPITFSSGDGAYVGGVQFPSASPFVTSVGGTKLTPAANSRGWTERTWVTSGANPPTQGSGSGCSAYELKPAWQSDAGCAQRTTADVSAVAANVLSYDTYDSGGSWFFSFGTSVSSPLIAAAYALGGGSSTTTSPASVAYTASASSRFDIITGKTGTCTPAYLCRAGTGYDGPTGLGTPKHLASFTLPATPPPSVSTLSESGAASNPTITVTGTHLGPFPPPGAPETCNAGDTGDVFGSVGLSLNDSTAGWTAGQSGDCIGLLVTSWSATGFTLTFGNQYANYTPAQPGDTYTLELQGSTFTGTIAAG